MSVIEDTRSSRRLSGQNPEMPSMVKQPSLYQSRIASRNTSRQPTREPSPDPDDQYLQEQAQQESEEQDDPVTPPQIQKGKVPEIPVIQPTPSHAAPEQNWVDDPPDRPPTDDEAKQLAELFYNLTNLDKKWDPKAPMMDPSPEELIQLAATINELVRDNPMPLMAGMYPKTPRKPLRHSAAYPVSRSAPKKAAGYLSRTASTLGLPRLSTTLFGTSNPTPAQPAPTSSTSAAPLPMQHPANFPSSSAKSGPTPFGFQKTPDITLNSGNQDTSQQAPQQQQTQNEPPPGGLPRRVSLLLNDDPPDDSSSSDSGVSLPDNRRTSRCRSRRSQTADTTRTSASSTLGTSSLKLPKLATNDSRDIYKTAAVFDAWVRDLRDHLELAEMDLESSHAMIWVGMHLKDSTKMLHTQFRANEDTKYMGVEEFLKALRHYGIPFTSKETLWNEFQAVRQMLNGRTLPIQDIANKIKQYQMQLPRTSNWQCYHQLLKAMDAPLLQAV